MAEVANNHHWIHGPFIVTPKYSKHTLNIHHERSHVTVRAVEHATGKTHSLARGPSCSIHRANWIEEFGLNYLLRGIFVVRVLRLFLTARCTGCTGMLGPRFSRVVGPTFSTE